MNRRLNEFLKDKTLTKYTFFIIFTAGLLYALYFTFKNFGLILNTTGGAISGLLDTLAPLFIGLLLAYFFNPLVEIINAKIFKKAFATLPDPVKNKKRQKRNRLLSVLLSYIAVVLAIVALIYGFAAMVMGQIVFDSLSSVIKQIGKSLISYETTLTSWIKNLPAEGLSEKLQNWINSFLKWLYSNISTDNIISTTKDFIGGMVSVVIGLVISIYLSYDKEFFIALWNKLLRLIFPQKASKSINGTLHEVNGIISLFLRGILLDALIVAILSSIGLTIIGLKFGVFLGIFAGISNIIPYFGPVLGMVPAFFIGLLTDGPKEGAFAIIVLLIVQQLDGHIVYPKVVGESTGLHPLFVLLAVLIGGAYGGLMGMIVAVPIAAVLQLFIKKLAKRREKKLALKGNDIAPCQCDDSPSNER